MRKHFLILMLLSLLPFTAWAANLVEIGATLVAPSYVYGEDHELKVAFQAVQLTLNDDPGTIELVGYYADNNGVPGNQVNIDDVGVGTYWVKVRGINDYEGELQASFIISPRPVTIKFTTIAVDFGYQTANNYEGDQPIILAMNEGSSTKVTFKDYGEDNFVALTQAQIENMGLVVGRATPAAYNAGDYAFTKQSNENYEVTIDGTANPAPTFHITGINISTLNNNVFALANNATAEEVYSGEAFSRNVVYTGNDQGVTFTLTWKDANNDLVNELINVGQYKAVLSGTGNYEGTKTLDNIFSITPKALTILVNPKNEAYTGNSYAAANVEYTIGGLVDKDQGKVDLTTLVPSVQKKNGDNWDNADFPVKNVATYKVSVDAANAKIQTGVENNVPVYGALSANYTVNTTASEWIISKAALTLTAASKTAQFGDNDVPPSTVTATVAVAAEKAAIEAAYKAVADNYDLNSYGVQQNVYTPTRKAAADYEGDEAAKAAAVAAADVLLNNYVEPTVAAGTLVKGSLTVGSGAFTIMPVIASKQYDGTALEATGYYAYNGNYALTNDDIDVNTISYKYKNVTPGATTGTDWHTGAPTEVGIYRVKVENTVAGKGSFLNAEPTCDEVEFQIQKKKLVMTVHNVALWNNATSDDLQDKGDVDDYRDQLVEGEDISFKYVFVPQNGYDIAEDAQTHVKTITFNLDEDIVGAISIEMDGDDVADNAHYEFDFENQNFTLGTLTKISGNTLTLNGTAQSLIDFANAAGNCAANEAATYTVTVTGRALKANQWNAMVLPFAVKPLDFCNALNQYAVFNTLDKVEKDANNEVLKDKIYFKLNMDEIPANTPFLVKPLTAVAANTNIVIAGVKVVDEGTDPVYTGVDGAKFTGTYKATADINSTNWWALAGGVFKHFSAERENGLKFTNAFIELTSGASAAEFFVEDIDIETNTTAIKSLNLDTMQSVDMDGWYTVGGVKLQGVPTQKGVYINNGKKVVLK